MKLIGPLFLIILLACGCSKPAKADSTHGTSPAPYVAALGGALYHKPTCRLAQKIDPLNLREYRSIEDALNAGYAPCDACRPLK